MDRVDGEQGGSQEAGGGPEEQPGDGRVVEQQHHRTVEPQVGQVESSGAETEEPDCQPATGGIVTGGRSGVLVLHILSLIFYLIHLTLCKVLDPLNFPTILTIF